MKLKALRGHIVAGKPVTVATVYEVDEALGRQLIATGKAVAVGPDRGPKPQKMTTKTAGALVGGPPAQEAPSEQV